MLLKLYHIHRPGARKIAKRVEALKGELRNAEF